MHLLPLLAFSALLFTSCAPPPRQAASIDHPSLRVVHLVSSAKQRLSLRVEMADGPEELRRGLMFRTSLEEGSGMLFDFGSPQMLTFWMKNTLIPLDVLFFDASGQFVSVQTMEPCTEDPCGTYPSHAPARYALEVPAGYAAREGIGDGWKLELAAAP